MGPQQASGFQEGAGGTGTTAGTRVTGFHEAFQNTARPQTTTLAAANQEFKGSAMHKTSTDLLGQGGGEGGGAAMGAPLLDVFLYTGYEGPTTVFGV